MYVNSHFCLDHFAPSFPKVAICGLQGSVTDFRVRNLQKSQNRHTTPASGEGGREREKEPAASTAMPNTGGKGAAKVSHIPGPDAHLLLPRMGVPGLRASSCVHARELTVLA